MQFDPRYYQGNGNFDDEIGGYAGYEVPPQGTHRPVKHLGNAEQAILAQRLAKQQAETRARQRNLRGNSHVSPDALPRGRQQPVQQEDDELYGDEDLSTHPPRSAFKYQPEEIYQSGNTSIYAGQLFVPKKRRNAQQQLPPAQQYQQDQDIEGSGEQEPERTRGDHSRVHTHWLVYAGIGAIIALTLWISGAWVTNWWTNTQNDWTYTAQFRTFSTDAVVGHNHDSSSNPSHFIVQNDKRHIIIIELPADDFSKSIIYSAPTLIGDGQEKTPATISFQANVQTGRLDMVLHVENQTYLFSNNGTKFVAPQGQ